MFDKTPIRLYRLAVFAIAIFYVIYTIVLGNYASPGGPFRYLTIWGLTMSTLIAGHLFLRNKDNETGVWGPFVSSVAVVNAMVVFLYWRLYFADASSVKSDGELGPLWLEVYMHLMGQVLMWIDALFINRVFSKLKRAALVLAATVVAYLSWAEIFVGPMNAKPVGFVTSGLPYPFLNNMVFSERLIFYGANIAVAFVFLGLFALVAYAIRQMLPRGE